MPGRSRALAISEDLMSTSNFLRDTTNLSPESTDGGEEMEQGGVLDSQLWHACAGGMVQLPVAGSRVIYFPQGHAEQAARPVSFPPSVASSATIPCRVLSVKFLAERETDEVSARIKLLPDHGCLDIDDPPSPDVADKPESFSKTLTQSDANNGGGFSVPRYCAETIFPKLDYSVDPPVQTILAKDVHGETWKFRHIYRGTPRRHLLTTGWSTFVNQKKLVAGDAIVFLRSAKGELCVGVRRSTRSSSNGGGGGGDSLCWQSSRYLQPLNSWEQKPGTGNGSYFDKFCAEGGSAPSFACNHARVSAISVVEAATMAAAGLAFEVVYYPRASRADFIVRAEAVRAALDQEWYPGARFKMAFETDDLSRISWFMGNISAVHPVDPLLFPGSPWRVLQVTWDEPDFLQGMSRVNPWQVELVSTLPTKLGPLPPPKKKLRISTSQEFQIAEGQGYLGLPTTISANNMLGQMNPWYCLSEDFPAGMQGARQERIYGIVSPDLYPYKGPGGIPEVYHQGVKSPGAGWSMDDCDHFVGNTSRITSVNTSQNESPSATTPSQSGSTHGASFVLFGKAIYPALPSTPPQQNSGGSSSEGYSESSCTGEIGSLKWVKEEASVLSSEKKDLIMRTDGDSVVHCKIFMEREEVGRMIDLSLFHSYEELYEKLSDLFSLGISKLLGRIIYKDLEGSTIHVGGEPYRNFMKSVRRLTILS